MVGSIERKLILELNSVGVQARLPARQGESLIYRIAIAFTWNGRDYFPDGAVWAEVRATLPDGRVISSDCAIENGRRCIFIPGADFFGCGGTVLCRIILRGDDGGELCAPVFAIDAEPSNAFAENAAEAETYSRLAELLCQVMAEKRSLGAEVDEKIAELVLEVDSKLSEFGVIEETKTTLDSRDFFPVYNLSNKAYARISWPILGNLIRKQADGNISAKSITDPETGYIARLPELEDDSVIALVRDLEEIADNFPTEKWNFELADGTTVTKQVVVK